MPTTYAHWRFGVDCIETLPENLQKVIHENRAIFDFGVHGPDVFFYDLKHPELPQYGHSLHQETGKSFFGNCAKVYKENSEDKEKMLAYILGLLSHYAFDSQAHAYINKKDLVTKSLTHNKIEAEYDAHLMRQDGKAIRTVNRAASLKPDKKDSEVMSRFFKFNAEDLYRTCKGQKLIIGAFYSRTKTARFAKDKIMRKFMSDSDADLLIQDKELESCRDSNLRIDKLKENALKLYPELVDDFLKAVNEDKELPDYFEHNFDPKPDDTTPVLSYEEELNYKPDFN